MSDKLGPISSHTIRADDPVPESHDYELTLTFKLTSLEELDYPELGSMLQHVLWDWRDGRYPFHVEMVYEGLAQCLKNAMYHHIERQCQQEFGREMVITHGERGKTAKWYIETQKRYAECKHHWLQDKPEVKIT